MIDKESLSIYDKYHIFAVQLMPLNKIIMKKLQFGLFLFLILGSIHITSAQFVSDLKKVETTIKNERAKIFSQILNRTKNPQIVDIRTPREYASGHLKGAILINYYDPDFAQNIEKAGLDKYRPVFIYCRSGHRSAKAIDIFKKLGFKHIVNMVYGINEWKHLLLPLEKGMPAKNN